MSIKRGLQNRRFIRAGRTMSVISIAALLCAFVSMPRMDIMTTIDIDAPVETVWSILVDNTAYPVWNPYHVAVVGNMALDETLDVEIHKPNGEIVHIKPRVMRIEPLQELTWGGGVRGVFFGEHSFLLEVVDTNRTRLLHREHFSGFAIPFAALDGIGEGYDRMNRALKQTAEGTIR